VPFAHSKKKSNAWKTNVPLPFGKSKSSGISSRRKRKKGERDEEGGEDSDGEVCADVGAKKAKTGDETESDGEGGTWSDGSRIIYSDSGLSLEELGSGLEMTRKVKRENKKKTDRWGQPPQEGEGMQQHGEGEE
jgi:hypothetical protein